MAKGRGRSKTTCRRTVENEMKLMQHSWGTLTRLAPDKQGWRSLICCCPTHDWVYKPMMNNKL